MKKTKYFKTESNSKKNKIYKDEMNQFNYRLFQINQENKKIKLNKLFLDEKELGLNQRIKSTKKENNIRASNFIDVNKRNSFDNIDLWLKEIGERFLEPSMVLFGNKADIEKNEWKVTEDEIQKNVEQYNLKYFETSAKTKKILMKDMIIFSIRLLLK